MLYRWEERLQAYSGGRWGGGTRQKIVNNVDIYDFVAVFIEYLIQIIVGIEILILINKQKNPKNKSIDAKCHVKSNPVFFFLSSLA